MITYFDNYAREQLDRAGIHYHVMEAEKERDVCIRYHVMSAPTLILTDGGEEMKRYTGLSNIMGLINHEKKKVHMA